MYGTYTRSIDVITKPRFSFSLLFSCPSGGPVNVRVDSDSESEQPVLQSGARRRWQRRRADVDRREDATVPLDRDAVNVVKDGVHCIVCNAQSMYMDVTVGNGDATGRRLFSVLSIVANWNTIRTLKLDFWMWVMNSKIAHVPPPRRPPS